MADLAVGLAKSVVEGALTKAQSAIEEDSRLRQSAQRDLVFITGEFQMMQSFLKLADDERTRNIVVRTWVRQIRELAYDVEDCIEFVLHLDKKSQWWRRMLPSFIAAATQPLDEAIAEIRQLKARVEDVSSRNARYSLISDSGSKPAVVQQQPPAAARAAMGAAAFSMLVEATDIAKWQHGDLTQLITKKDDGLQVISVWGTGGDLGTLSIIRKAYEDPEISQNFSCRAWVKLTHPFSPLQFIRSLKVQFYANSCKEPGSSNRVGVLKMMEATQDDLETFMKDLDSKKYIIVLEDVSTIVDWDAIRMFIPSNKGSCIIVSTQQSEIASVCVGHTYQVLELKQFSTDHSVYAFREGSQGEKEKDKEVPAEHGVRADTVLTSENNATPAWMMNYSITGRESEMKELCEYATRARLESLQVISVWGIAGVGKSALLKQFFCERFLSNLHEKCRWVEVSHPFNLRDFSRSLLLDFHSKSLQAQEAARHGTIRFKNPIQECRDLLEQHNCLVIIDDLQSKEEWDLIKAALLSRSSKSIIIVITTDASIATCCADKEDLVFNVKGLKADAAIKLFHQEVRKKNPLSPLMDLRVEEAAKLDELILKCGGLPEVIVAIAGVLAKKTVTLMDTVDSTNLRFMHTLETNPEYDSLRGLFSWMYSYFRSCPDSLKPCIFYMSLFPRDQNTRRRRVVRRWVAEGYCRDTEDKSAEQNGEVFFSNLLDLSIIQQPPQLVTTTTLGDTRMISCRVNGFIREYIVSRRMEENLVFELEGSCNVTTQRTGRHLIIRDSWDRDKIVFQSMDFSRLRSLTVFGNWKQFFVSESMKLLRVLDLEDASGVEDADLEEMLKQLHRLKFISLRGCSEIHRLPSSFAHLQQLQTLDIRGTSIGKLPRSITRLQKLQYIRAGTSVQAEQSSTSCISVTKFCGPCHQVGVIVPGGIDKLTALHTFGVVNIGASGGNVILKELKDLTQLRKLGVSGINRRNSKTFFSAISGHVHLESLSVQLDKDSRGCLAGILLPLKTLQSLKLHGPVEKLPVLEISQDSKLTKLDLEMTLLTETDIELIHSLPKLCILRIKQLQNSKLDFCVEKNGLELHTYEKVKVLEIAFSSNLDVTFGANTMRSLELLKAHCCNGSSVKFSGLEKLSQLKEVLLKGCCDDKLKEELQIQLNGHLKKPTLKLEA
ncbi:disease resistance protein Pik-2-like [Lolium rigidum]|uniref:disease resistance protein Pik-2-like n=1 Tax=Lolium rigidum TaxID=89674 RepID=UPI001F5C20F4|nr:disease resistance protein Pik-2-like [Lolium rigidum]